MDYICGILNRFRKMPKTYYKKTFCNGFTGKATGLQWYFNGNHWNFCDGFYRASIVFFKQGSVRCGCHIETICESSSSDCNQMTETYILKDKTVNLACSMYFERPVDLK